MSLPQQVKCFHFKTHLFSLLFIWFEVCIKIKSEVSKHTQYRLLHATHFLPRNLQVSTEYKMVKDW